MPNHIINEVTLHGMPLEAVKDKILNADGKIDFEILLPLPLNFWEHSVGSDTREYFPGNHLDAATKTWGTKWNAYGQDDEEYKNVVEVDGSTVLTFQTAWATPRGWICAVFNTFNCPITSKWLDEGYTDAHIEQYILDDSAMGNRWSIETIESGTMEHKRLHKLLWGVEEFEDEE